MTDNKPSVYWRDEKHGLWRRLVRECPTSTTVFKRKNMNHPSLRLVAIACLMLACVTAQFPQAQSPAQKTSDSTPSTPPGPGGTSLPNANPFPSTYHPFPARPTLIRTATIMTAAGPSIKNGSILLRDGKIAAVGESITAPPDALVIDATGKYVTPGIIDVHSHIGVYPAPGVDANSDGNDLTHPVTANVWAEHSVWPQDPQIPRALARPVTTMPVLPGSGNLIAGRSLPFPILPPRTVQGMKFPGARS